MSSLAQHIERLAVAQRWSYRASTQSATEPAAWAAVALAAHGRSHAAQRPAQWLADLQHADGSVGVSAAEEDPRWPTSLAMLAWSAADRGGQSQRFLRSMARAAKWSLAARGKTAPKSAQVGHDTELVGWSWAAETHSWLEPTCIFVIGLRVAGFGGHARVREGVRLVVDRLLPDGGANYGNTIVLGQPLLPHVQPTGLALLALAGEELDDVRVQKSLDYLTRSIGPETAPASLALACMGLDAFGQRPSQAHQWIARALDQSDDTRLATYEQSLLLLAAADSPFTAFTQVRSTEGAAL